jgi:hypothetical protein
MDLGFYPLSVSISDGDSTILVSWMVELVEMSSGIEELSGEDLREQAIRIYPNPFTESMDIRYLLPFEAEVRIEVYDLTGRKTGILVSERLSPGVYSETWSGRDERGGWLSPGIYILRFVYQGRQDILVQERKVVISR